MTTLAGEIAAYEQRQGELESEHLHKWVVFREEELIGVYETLDDAADEAVRKFGRGPFLLRRVGEPPLGHPASLLHRPAAGAR